MSLKLKVLNSLKWSFLDQIFMQFVFVVFSIFLARILNPSDFGIVGMITIFSGFAALFIDMGFGTALIQKLDVSEEYFSSVFWLNIFFGITLYLFFFILAPYIALFYNEPKLVLLVRITSISFLINALTSIQHFLLIKNLQFKKKVVFNWISLIISYIVAFVLANRGFGYWSLVCMTLTSAVVNSFLLWSSSSWHPRFIFHWAKIKELSSFGMNVLGDTSVNYWSRNYDNFIIAKMLGSSELGIYTRAYSLMLLPLKNITSVISKVMFPAFSKKQGDVQSIKMYYLKIVKLIGLITFPAMIGLAFVSKEFVLLFFGAKWEKMIPILSILCIVGAMQSIVSLNGLIYNSMGKAKIAFRITLIVNFILIIAFSIGVNFGIIGISWSYLITCLLIYGPVYSIAIKQINTSLKEVFLELKGVLFAVFLMAVFLFLINFLKIDSLLISFITKIVLGISLYCALIFLFERELLLILKSKIYKIIKK